MTAPFCLFFGKRRKNKSGDGARVDRMQDDGGTVAPAAAGKGDAAAVDEDDDDGLAFFHRLSQGADLKEAEPLAGARRDELLAAHLATSVVVHEWRAQLRKLDELERTERRIEKHLRTSMDAGVYVPRARVAKALSGRTVAVCVPVDTQMLVDHSRIRLTAAETDADSHALSLDRTFDVLKLSRPPSSAAAPR